MDKIWVYHYNKWVKDTYSNQVEYVLRNNDEEDQTDNMIQLPHLNEPSILNGISLRYQKNQIYTFTGEILLSVNPCQDLGLYTHDIANRYRKHESARPHLYWIAQRALDNLHLQNQSILVSGESGAGKTHAAREIMKYLGSRENEKIIQSNPILECLGNASTIYNPNSSRFGKFINMYFEEEHMVGADIKTYLLEKRRVTRQDDGERNFHVFYQVGLEGEFKYRNGNDQEDSRDVENACTALDVNWTHIKNTVQGILWLGNDNLEKASLLLDLDHASLERVLRERTITTAGETISIPLSDEEKIVVKDSLAMTLYQRLFDTTIQQINQAVSRTKSLHTISILDIFGFECFARNSLEQFCINYSNERLQNQFNNCVFLLEQKEYKNEGIAWNEIEFPDNSICIQMIQGRVGIIDLLEEECKLPRGSDKAFTSKMNRLLEGTHTYSCVKRFVDSKFVVHHYAGQVEYETDGFVNKNRDVISHDLGVLMGKASNVKRSSTQRVGICSQFRTHLDKLISVIELNQTSYVRCIKPNMGLVSDCLDTQKVATQLKYCGVIEVIRIARSGFSIRIKHAEFERLYSRVIKKLKEKHLKGIVKGTTKYFMKHDSYEAIEMRRKEMLTAKTITLQTWIRASTQRKKYRTLVNGMNRLTHVVKVRHRSRTVTITQLQSWVRMSNKKQWFNTLRKSVVYIQWCYRFQNEKRAIHNLSILQRIIRTKLRKRVYSYTRVQTWYRCTRERRNYQMLRNTVIQIQSNYRRKKHDITHLKDKWMHEKNDMEQKTDEMRSHMIKCIDQHVVQKMQMADEIENLRVENVRLRSYMNNPKKSLSQLLKDWWLS